MTPPDQTKLFDAVNATWAPLTIHNHDGWLIREGAGGGQRVSAATVLPDTKDINITSAEEKMMSLGQSPLFMIRNTDTKLDAELHAMGYDIVDPVVLLMAPTNRLVSNSPKQTHPVKQLETPNADTINIWASGGIDKSRLNVMVRTKGPKTILSAKNMGVAFAAAYGDIAMVHAVEVANKHRRKGVANALMYEACQWAQDQNCHWTVVLTVRENIPARTLYETLGMTEAAAYHYRLKHSG